MKRILFFLLVFTFQWHFANGQKIALPSPFVTSVSFDTTSQQYFIHWVQDYTYLSKVKLFDIYKYGSTNIIDINTGKPQAGWLLIDTAMASIAMNYSKPLNDSLKVNFYDVEAEPNDSTFVSSTTNKENFPWVNAPSNIVLSGSFDSCSYKIKLNWNRLYGWDGGVSNAYKVYYKTENGNYAQISSAVFNTKGAKDTSITLPGVFYDKFNFQINTTYYFYIDVWNDDPNNPYDGLLNVIKITTTAPKPPSYISPTGTEIFNGNTSIKLKYNIDPNSQLTNYKVLSSVFSNKNFTAIAADTLSPGDNSIAPVVNYTYEDTIKYYKIELLNNCKASNQMVVDSSQAQSNISLLKITQSAGYNNITWNFSDKDADSINYFEVHRRIGTIDTIIKTTSSTSASEPQSNLANVVPGTPITYYIKALFKNPNKTSISNTQTIQILQDIMPIFFTPEGKNKTFGPLSVETPSRLHMIIYDRMGKKVFETNDPDGKWDGNYQSGGKAPQGVYIYYVKVTIDDKTTEKNGIVTLIRQ